MSRTPSCSSSPADDLGVSYATNSAVYDALRHGVATSAGLVVPGPWAREAAASYRGEDVGAHLTLNAEYDLYRWGPVTHAPSLLDGDGGFPRTLVDLWDHADMDEVRKECRAQIERAIYWGFDVSHLSAHLGALELRPEFFDVALDLAVDFRLPLRLPGADQQHKHGVPVPAAGGRRRDPVARPPGPGLPGPQRQGRPRPGPRRHAARGHRGGPAAGQRQRRTAGGHARLRPGSRTTRSPRRPVTWPASAGRRG